MNDKCLQFLLFLNTEGRGDSWTSVNTYFSWGQMAWKRHVVAEGAYWKHHWMPPRGAKIVAVSKTLEESSPDGRYWTPEIRSQILSFPELEPESGKFVNIQPLACPRSFGSTAKMNSDNCLLWGQKYCTIPGAWQCLCLFGLCLVHALNNTRAGLLFNSLDHWT